jgi:hypothetical protein
VRLRTVFCDVGAVIYLLRLVVWIIPGFSVEAYRDRLGELHACVGANGSYVARASADRKARRLGTVGQGLRLGRESLRVVVPCATWNRQASPG